VLLGSLLIALILLFSVAFRPAIQAGAIVIKEAHLTSGHLVIGARTGRDPVGISGYSCFDEPPLNCRDPVVRVIGVFLDERTDNAELSLDIICGLTVVHLTAFRPGRFLGTGWLARSCAFSIASYEL
jgi:hypothetical protein